MNDNLISNNLLRLIRDNSLEELTIDSKKRY
nr:MAG TPA: hypothetical protein [Crassvirales sp.]